MSERLIWNFEFSSRKEPMIFDPIPREPQNLKWEIRFFWPENQLIHLSTSDDRLQDLAHYQKKFKEDTYYLLPDYHFNIKRRRNKLVYKPLIGQSNQAFGYGQKINLEEIKPEQSDLIALNKMIKKQWKQRTELLVKKESLTYRFATLPVIKLELARLEIVDRIFFSACIEGKSLYLVETLSEYLFGKQVSCDYVTFLKSIIQ